MSINCINHRLALAAAHAADNIPYLKRFKETVQSLFLFYHNSAVNVLSELSSSNAVARLLIWRNQGGEGWGWEVVMPAPYASLGGWDVKSPFSLSPLEVTDHRGLEREKKRITTQVLYFFYRTAHA